MLDVVRRCKLCGKLVHDGMMNEEGFYAHEDCFKVLMDRDYGPGNWRGSKEELEYGGFYAVKEGDSWMDTGIFYTDFEDDDCVEYVAQYTDPDTGEVSEVDNFTAPEGLSLEEYLEDCQEYQTYADPEWYAKLVSGNVQIVEVDE